MKDQPLFKFHTRITHTFGDYIDVHKQIRAADEKLARDMMLNHCMAIGNAAWPEYPVFFTTTDSHNTPTVRQLSSLHHAGH
jgi:hypothetical protein